MENRIAAYMYHWPTITRSTVTRFEFEQLRCIICSVIIKNRYLPYPTEMTVDVYLVLLNKFSMLDVKKKKISILIVSLLNHYLLIK